MFYEVMDQAALHEALEMMAELWSGAYCMANPQDTILNELAWHPDFSLKEVA